MSSPSPPDVVERPEPRPDGERPFALVVGTAKGDVIHDVDPVAVRVGLAPGQRSTDAMAAHRDLAVAYGDPDYEARALKGLAAWARRWSPATRADGADGIALDLTGCLHLFGGETELMDEMTRRLSSLGFTARLAMAPNHAAAHALARFSGRDAVTVDEAGLEAALAPLPVAALRIDAASVTLLRRLGLKTVEQAARVPRATLKKRFGANRKVRDPRDETYDDYLGRSIGATADVLARLDEALGRVRVPLDPERPEPRPRVTQGLAEPVSQVETVLACLRPLIGRLAADLDERDMGLVALGVEAFRVDGGRASTLLRLSRPTRDVGDLMRLLLDRLDGWHAEFGFDALAVEAVEAAPLPPEQRDGLEAQRRPDPFALVDRLRTRLGEMAVRRASLRASHVPERAEAWLPALTCTNTHDEISSHAARPDRMFEFPEEIAVMHGIPNGPPVRFTWRRGAYRIERVAGPERIAPQWWRERSHARARDYWRVETSAGERFWLYREGFDGDERGGHTRWFVHGLFS